MEQIPGKSRGNRLETRECGAMQREISRILTNDETDLKKSGGFSDAHLHIDDVTQRDWNVLF
jgi:hypothetical protein